MVEAKSTLNHRYKESEEYQIIIEVVDIFGNDMNNVRGVGVW